MPGKIFYRVRRQSEPGFKQPRFQWVAHTVVRLDLCGKHLRLRELKCIAEAVGAELVMLPGSPPLDEKS